MAETAVSESESESESHPPFLKVAEVEFVKCESCESTEECTPEYISRVRETYRGRWICGLCVEAVKDEVMISESLITVEEALNRHISFCESLLVILGFMYCCVAVGKKKMKDRTKLKL